MVHKRAIAYHSKIPQFQVLISQVPLFSLFVFLNHVGVRDADFKIDRVSDRVVGLPHQAVLRRETGRAWFLLGLNLELFIIAPLLLLFSLLLIVFHFLRIDLIFCNLALVVELLLSLPWLAPVLLLYLILKESPEHIPLLVVLYNLLLLIPSQPCLVLLHLFSLDLGAAYLSLLVVQCGFAVVNALEPVLSVHEMAVVLLVDWVFLCLKLVSY